MESDTLTCRELAELMTDYLEGVLSPAERNRFRRHLVACRVCPRYLAQFRHTVRLVGRLTEDDVQEPARAELLAAFRDWKAR